MYSKVLKVQTLILESSICTFNDSFHVMTLYSQWLVLFLKIAYTPTEFLPLLVLLVVLVVQYCNFTSWLLPVLSTAMLCWCQITLLHCHMYMCTYHHDSVTVDCRCQKRFRKTTKELCHKIDENDDKLLTILPPTPTIQHAKRAMLHSFTYSPANIALFYTDKPLNWYSTTLGVSHTWLCE